MAEETKNDGGSLIDEPVASQIVQELTQGYREWEHGGKKYRTRFPTAEEDGDARIAYARSFNKSLEEGLLTQKQMENLLKNRGIWTEEDEKKVSSLREKIGHLETLLAKKSPKDKSKATTKLAEELAGHRLELLDITGGYQEYMNQTVETLADERRTAYYIASCTTNADGSRVWDTVEEFLRSQDGQFVSLATFHYVTFSNGLAENYLDDLTEVKFLMAGVTEDLDEG